MSEVAKQAIAEVSHINIDELIKPKSFTAELEESIRGHIHEELTSWLFFRKLAADCSSANICLHGFAMLFDRFAAQCLLDMHWLEKYLITRGGTSKPTPIHPPSNACFPSSPVEPVRPTRDALAVQKRLLEDLERLVVLATRSGDTSLAIAVENRFLRKQVRYVKDLGDLLQQVTRVSKQAGLGLYQLDMELRKFKGKISWAYSNDPDKHDRQVDDLVTRITEGMEVTEGAKHHGFGH
ncbi:hypothetical protein ASPZODRAFT_19384 [Penicilliopsis zonata CBS 506.65]|uniref:Ferritin n=1 Tax=Penicilliopsis zonata CBS 506.65 TaxID=1073090 RepID=A0A1L9S934_9EURO|nr:hypothetical protein ASPZODRAFT_19384 [Penicilliopsis zonata CBS 506.65]OJJ43667.1 hypothetical protein ASPZODRAFT_19384 [Penicilliopsis zonata CBS 506.65]